MSKDKKEKPPQKEYAVWLRSKGAADLKLGLVQAPEPDKACHWAVKRHRAFLKRLECGNYSIVVTDLRTEMTSSWAVDTLLQAGAVKS